MSEHILQDNCDYHIKLIFAPSKLKLVICKRRLQEEKKKVTTSFARVKNINVYSESKYIRIWIL